MKRFDVTDIGKLIEIKRLYIPLIINVKCPKCGRGNDHDFEDSELSYPKVNTPIQIGVYCYDCEEVFYADITLRIAVELDENSVKVQD